MVDRRDEKRRVEEKWLDDPDVGFEIIEIFKFIEICLINKN